MKQTLQKLLSLRLLMAFALVMGAYGATWADDFELYSGEITAGDYLVVYNGRAMQASVSGNRLEYVDVEINDDVISNTNESIIWTIAADGDYFTLYNAATSKYAASNGTKNQAKLESNVSDNSRWTVTGDETYEFVNKANKAKEVNCNLRNNGTYGFACYSTATGGALSLYKKKVSDPSKLNAELSFDGETNEFTVNLGSTFTAPQLINPHSLDVVFKSSNVGVASVDPGTGEVTIVGAGQTIISATFAGNDDYNEGSASYTLTVVDPNAPGTENKPYSVAGAIAAIDNGGTTQGVYVQGIVAKVDKFNSTYHSITYWISDNGTTVNQFEVYSGKGIGGADFSSIDDIQVGDQVVIYGDIKLFGTSTYEFDKNNQLVSLSRVQKVDPQLSFSATSVTVNLGETFTAPTLANPNNLTGFIWTSTDTDVATVDSETGEVTILSAGEADIVVDYPGNESYDAGSATYTITVVDPSIPQLTYYALVAQYDGKYYAMNSNGGATWGATEVDAVNGKVVTAQSDAISWFITPATTASTTKVKFQNKASGKYLNHTTSTSLSEGATSANWDIDKENDTWKNNSSRTMLYRETANGFKNYSASNANSSDYSDYTHAYTFADGYVRRNLTSTWGTICLPSTVEAEDLAGAKFYSIAGKVVNSANEATSIVLEEETVGLIAGVPYIFELNEGSTKVVAAYQDDEDPATSNNGLVGSLEGQAVDEGMYLLSGGKVVKCGTGCSIAANRAYIDMSQVSVYSGPTAGVKMLGVGGNIADSITAIDGEIRSDVIYNLAGQRLQRPVRGINIIGGKKVLVK